MAREHRVPLSVMELYRIVISIKYHKKQILTSTQPYILQKVVSEPVATVDQAPLYRIVIAIKYHKSRGTSGNLFQSDTVLGKNESL